jgi:hypothetical protein
MAHFAQLDENNVVISVVKVNNEDILENGIENEQLGIEFCKQLHGPNTRWVQTSYNNNFRRMYAHLGDIYNQEYDIFLSPKPFPSWTFNTTTKDWEAPTPHPNDLNNYYSWDENNQQWILIPEAE